MIRLICPLTEPDACIELRMVYSTIYFKVTKGEGPWFHLPFFASFISIHEVLRCSRVMILRHVRQLKSIIWLVVSNMCYFVSYLWSCQIQTTALSAFFIVSSRQRHRKRAHTFCDRQVQRGCKQNRQKSQSTVSHWRHWTPEMDGFIMCHPQKNDQLCVHIFSCCIISPT